MNKALACFALIGACLAISAAYCADTEKSTKYIRPFPIVGLPDNADKDHQALADEVAKAIGSKLILKQKSNPICCVWLEISLGTPNPGEPGYIIVNQGGGSLIMASDVEQLRKAVARFKGSLRKVKDGVEVPEGVMTSFPVISEK